MEIGDNQPKNPPPETAEQINAKVVGIGKVTPAKSPVGRRIPVLLPPDESTEKFSFRHVQGTRQTIKDTIEKARLMDPATRKPSDNPLPDPIKNYLFYVLDSLDGDAFVMDAHVHSSKKTEWHEHIHIKKIF